MIAYLMGQIAALRARIAYLEAKLGQPPKTPEKSSVPPFEFSAQLLSGRPTYSWSATPISFIDAG